MKKRLAENFKELAETKKLSDCRIIVEAADGSKTIFECHKIIFVAASEFFERIFNDESNPDEIVLKHVKPNIFNIFREYIYNYDKKLLKMHDENKLIDLILFGHQYMVTSITEECIKILIQRIKSGHRGLLVSLYQVGHDILREDLIKVASENIICGDYHSMDVDAVYELSSDVFINYMEVIKGYLKESIRFSMIDKYLKLKGFDMSKSSDVGDRELEQYDQGNENELEANNKSETKKNVPIEYVKNLLQLIDYKEMTPEEFTDGPGKSQYCDLLKQ